MVLIGRMDSGSGLLKVRVPEGVFPVGRLRLSFVGFSYCEIAAHNHFVEAPNVRVLVAGQPAYRPQVEVNRITFAINYRDPVRAELDLPVPTHAKRRQSERVEPPHVTIVDNEPVRWGVDEPAAGDPDPAAADPAADPEPEGEQEQRRERRALRTELAATELNITFGFNPDDLLQFGMDKLAKDAGHLDFDARTLTTKQIVERLSGFLTFWANQLGVYGSENEVGFPYIKTVPMTEAEQEAMIATMNLPADLKVRPKLDNHVFVEIGLPQAFGISLPMNWSWRMLGFLPDKYKTFYQVGEQSRKWVVGNAQNAAKYLLGVSPNGTVHRASLAVNLDETGEELMKSWCKRQGKEAASLPPDGLLGLDYRPRLVIDPPEYSYRVDLKRYKFPDEKKGRLAMLRGLVDVVMGKARAALGCKKSFSIEPMVFAAGAERTIAYTPAFDATAKGACFFTRLQFGSRDLSRGFGLLKANFSLDLRNYRGQAMAPGNHVGVPADQIAELVLDETTDNVWLTDEEKAELNLQMKNVVTDTLTVPKIAESTFFKIETADYASWLATHPDPEPEQQQQEVEEAAAAEEGQEPAAEREEEEEGQEQQQQQQQQLEVPLEPEPAPSQIRVDAPNPLPRPRESYVPLGIVKKGECSGEPNRNVPVKFPNSFYIVSEQGERRDYFQELGHVCLAGKCTKEGTEWEKNRHFFLNNGSTGSITLDFYIYNVKNLVLFENTSGNAGFARCTMSLNY